MKHIYDLSQNVWQLSGWTPEVWRMHGSVETGDAFAAEIPAMECRIPCSVQKVLRDNRVIEDWNAGLKFRDSEWIEHRHWMFTTTVPGSVFGKGKKYFFVSEGLDYKGEIYFNGVKIGAFENSFLPVRFPIYGPFGDENRLTIVFLEAPPWLGQFGRTSRITSPKVRFYYGWDWTCRFVQTGIWDSTYIEENSGNTVCRVTTAADADPDKRCGILHASAVFEKDYRGPVVLKIEDASGCIFSAEENAEGDFWQKTFSDIPAKLWDVNLEGEQNLYTVSLSFPGIGETVTRRIGFRHIEWKHTRGAAPERGKWLCSINGRDTFLQGFNWVPPYHNFADCTSEDYAKLIKIYKDLGVNVLRVNGVGVLGPEEFYRLCDEAGILIWQELPMSSSALDNTPPCDEKFTETMVSVFKGYIMRRQHHPSLLLWSGGNELFTDSHLSGRMKPCTDEHPMLKRLQDVARKEDPYHRFITGSPTGGAYTVDDTNRGKGINENVHGPWKASSIEEWSDYFRRDDAMFRSETGAPGASSLDVIYRYSGGSEPMPVANENVFWARPFHWWLEVPEFASEFKREPASPEEYVIWSQRRQAQLLYIAARETKRRFPECGGFMVWMGHDVYPCPCNTSVIDYNRNLKPAALSLGLVFRKKPEELCD
ncbi:MAG: hypothetical protein ILO36_07250 [Abditibacteriota bacterium]|nr:hypothetical protein [Abditibacteriota bacterium]